VKVTIRGDLALLAAVSVQRLAIRMGSMGASVLKILQNAIASVRLVTQLVGSSVVFSVSFQSGLLCRERQTGSDHRCHQWHWAGGGRRARRTRRE